MNKHFIDGRVGNDPEIHAFPDGSKVANFSIATTKRWTDSDGQKQERTTWHSIKATGGVVGVVEKYLKKGDKVTVMGEPFNHEWESSDGSKRSRTVVHLKEIELQPNGRNEGSETNHNQGVEAPF